MKREEGEKGKTKNGTEISWNQISNTTGGKGERFTQNEAKYKAK